MGTHRMSSVTVGVPNLAETSAYYAEFGLTPVGAGWFATSEGGPQLRLVSSPLRRLVGFVIGVDDEDDLARAESRFRRIEVPAHRAGDRLITVDPASGTEVTLRIEPRRPLAYVPPPLYNGPGRPDRIGTRAPGIMRPGPVRPRALGHVVLGTVDWPMSLRYFTEGIGFKVSDLVKEAGAFLRVTKEHHNLLLLKTPVNFLHHTSWQVADVDEVGRGAMQMLQDNPERHVWGLGRHHVGSNFFWYLKDPAGNFSEYYADTDCIVDDQLWKPETFEGVLGLYSWGPPPPPSFIRPDDLAALMTGAHSSR
ncbi:VOC family protein [Micromonospora mangrovi]|uniref:VOC family protein n=2 Tax=Micromonospora TaxID=1873 RepID=A0AAU8HE65_9ACTN